MMDTINKIPEIVKKYKKDILIIIGSFLLILLLIFFIRERKLHKDLLIENYSLIKSEDEAARKTDSLIKVINLSEKNIEVLNEKIDSIIKATTNHINSLTEKEKDYLAQINQLKSIPPDTIYKRILVYNSNINNDPLNYRFGSSQIRTIYDEHISMLYLREAKSELLTVVSLDKAMIKLKDSVIQEKDVQISSLNTRLTLNSQLINVLHTNNNTLQKSLKTQKFWKGFWRCMSIGEAGYMFLNK